MSNYNKKTFNKRKRNNKVFVFIIIFLLFTVFLFFLMNKYYKDKFTMVNYYMSYPYIFVRDSVFNFQDSNKLRKENIELKKELSNLEIIRSKNIELEKDILTLKDNLNLKNIYSSYSLINSTVISRNKNYWFNELTIDKGSSSGITESMAVVTGNGLIGKVIKAYNNNSVVKIITNSDSNNKISVAVETTDGFSYGTITDYDSTSNLLVVTGITNYDKVGLNSKVVTTGLGTFPSGITIGYVKEIVEDNYSTSKILYIESNQDFNNINYVTVLGNVIQ